MIPYAYFDVMEKLCASLGIDSKKVTRIVIDCDASKTFAHVHVFHLVTDDVMNLDFDDLIANAEIVHKSKKSEDA